MFSILSMYANQIMKTFFSRFSKRSLRKESLESSWLEKQEKSMIEYSRVVYQQLLDIVKKESNFSASKLT